MFDTGVAGGQRGSNHVATGVAGGQQGSNHVDTEVAGDQRGSNHVDTEVAGGQRGSNHVDTEVAGGQRGSGPRIILSIDPLWYEFRTLTVPVWGINTYIICHMTIYSMYTYYIILL